MREMAAYVKRDAPVLHNYCPVYAARLFCESIMLNDLLTLLCACWIGTKLRSSYYDSIRTYI